MSKQTLYKNFKDLKELGIIKASVKASKKMERAVIYRINKEHPLVKRLKKIINETFLQIAKQAEMQAQHV
ncbi:MAG: hypothetical protein QXT31_07290 [Candidatus Bathyarchaeia archaeon]